MGWQNYDETKDLVLKHMQMNSDGHFYFPLFPWTLIMVVMNGFPLVNVSISIALVFLCLNLMVAIDIINDNPDENNDNQYYSRENDSFSVSFAIIGSILLLCGFVINVNMILLPNLGYFSYQDVLHRIFTPMTSGSLSLFVGGLLALKVASHGGLWKKFTLFLLSISEFLNSNH